MIDPRQYRTNGLLLVMASPLAIIMIVAMAVAVIFWPQLEDWFNVNAPGLSAAIAAVHPST